MRTVKAGGVEIITGGGTEHGATVSSGGIFVALGSASVGGDTFLGGAVVELGSGFKHPAQCQRQLIERTGAGHCPVRRHAQRRRGPHAAMW